MIEQYLPFGKKERKVPIFPACKDEQESTIDKKKKRKRKNLQKDEQRNDQHIYQELENTPGKHNLIVC
jgi:hypothetical protein